MASTGGGSLGSDVFARSPSPPPRLTLGQQAAFFRLNASQQAQFSRIWGSANPPAQQALAMMLADGRLVQGPDLRTGQNLLQHLFQMATQDLPAELERPSLLSGLIQQVQDPGLIHQGNRGTCAVTTGEYMLAKSSPAEYARIVTGLAAPSGSIVLASGKKAERVKDSMGADNSGRSEASRLFQSAMMAVAIYPLRYSNPTDREGLGDFLFLSSGLWNPAIPRILSAVLGENFRNVSAVPLLGTIPKTEIGRERLVNRLQSALAEGRPVPGSLDWRTGGHEVLFLKIENERVFFRNPWGNGLKPGTETDGQDGPQRRIEAVGGIESIPLDELRRRVSAILVR